MTNDITNTDETDGAIDNEFSDSERDAVDILQEHWSDVNAPTWEEMSEGDVAIDLVTHQPLLIIEKSADNLAEYYEDEGFDLLTYNQHAWLPVRLMDTVFECVFIGQVDGLHKFSNTYHYPAGRLARVPVEIASEGME